MSPLSTPTPSSTPRTDRRVRPRKRIAASATVMTRGRLMDAVALDVSSGGLKIVSTTPLPPGAKVEVALIVDGELVDALATIRWSAPHGAAHYAAGLAFDQLDHEARAHLAHLCGAALS